MTEQAKVPAIRFAGFTDPWEQRKFGDCFEFLKSNTLSRAGLNGENGTARNVHYGDILIKFGDCLDGERSDLPFITDDTVLPKYAGSILREGDVIFADTAEDETAGKCVELRKLPKEPTISGLHTIPARPRFPFGTGYLGHYLNSDAYHRQLLPLMQGIKVISVSKAALQDTQVRFPGLSEQSAIGAALNEIDSLITLHQRKYDKLVILKKSMLEKMFPKDGESVPEIRFAGFTDPWEQRKFSEIVDVCSGRDYKHLDEGPIPVYGTGGYMTSVSEALSHNRDAIGIGRKGTIDKPYLLKAPFWTVDTLFYAIPKSDINLEFALCSFLNVDWKSKDESTGLPSLSKESINEAVLSVPNVVEQNHLGNFFADLDRLITLHQRKLELLQNIKKSLLDKMFV